MITNVAMSALKYNEKNKSKYVEENAIQVSVIIPIHNGEKWIDRCFTSLLNQTARSTIKYEICVYNDSSTDLTTELLEKWAQICFSHRIDIHICHGENKLPKGVGYAKNRAIEISKGTYLCFQDVDDIMMPKRIEEQFNFAVQNKLNNSIIGSQFQRLPIESTPRFTRWANSLSTEELQFQIYTSHGPTVIMPTWFMHRNVFEKVGGFSENGKGTPEDLIFFYKHLELGGKIDRLDKSLLIYQYHQNATTFSIHENTIWNLRVQKLQNSCLNNWPQFTIWNAGKQGRKLFKSLSDENKVKVVALCDVDVKKIGKFYENYDEIRREVTHRIPILHFSESKSPLVICVKLDMTNENFEQNLKSLNNLKENEDYIIFS